MTAITKHSPKDFSEVMAVIEQFQGDHDESWYRGVGDHTYKLLPSLTRRTVALDAERLDLIEKGIANRFIQRSPPFVNIDLSSEWRLLFFMQHYGIPTRLLDWSESPFVGLYFALTSAKRDKVGKVTSDVALWMCDPVAWNQKALTHISFTGGILDESCEEVKSYSPSGDVDQRATIPIMIFGTHNSPRIVAQRGVFALFGKGMDGMDEIFSKGSFPKGSLEKIVIRKELVDDLLASLYRKGVAESTIYPDIFGLALEIRRGFGYH